MPANHLMPLFTFFLEFAGGTYVSQVRAASWKSAPAAWSRRLRYRDVRGMGPRAATVLRRALVRETTVPLEGLESAWCTTAILRGKLALIHYVETNG